MLDPEAMTDAFVAAAASVPDFVTALGGVDRIVGHRYFYGTEAHLALAVAEMTTPGILIAWRVTVPGNFNGMTVFKHHFEVYIRSANMASVAFPAVPTGAGRLWWLLFNKPLDGTTVNIRYTEFLPGLIMETPGISARQDEELQDYFCASVVFAEMGDD